MTTVREPFSPQFPCSQRVRLIKSVSFAMWTAEKAGVFQAPQPLCEEDSLVADAAVLRLPGILSLLLVAVMLPITVPGNNGQSSEQILSCWKNISTCASLKSCQFCQLMGRSCSNPVHVDHQY